MEFLKEKSDLVNPVSVFCISGYSKKRVSEENTKLREERVKERLNSKKIPFAIEEGKNTLFFTDEKNKGLAIHSLNNF